MKNSLTDITWITEIILEGADCYNLITAANQAGRGITEECHHLLYEVVEISDEGADYNIGDAGVTYLDGGDSLGIDLQLELPGTLAVAIEEIAEEWELSFPEAVTKVIQEGLSRI